MEAQLPSKVAPATIVWAWSSHWSTCERVGKHGVVADDRWVKWAGAWRALGSQSDTGAACGKVTRHRGLMRQRYGPSRLFAARQRIQGGTRRLPAALAWPPANNERCPKPRNVPGRSSGRRPHRAHPAWTQHVQGSGGSSGRSASPCVAGNGTQQPPVVQQFNNHPVGALKQGAGSQCRRGA